MASDTTIGVTNLAFPVFDPHGNAITVVSCPFLGRIDELKVPNIDEVHQIYANLASELTAHYGGMPPYRRPEVPFSTRKIASCGVAFSTLGFGSAPLGGLFSAVTDDEAKTTLSTAFHGGMKCVDTAPFYSFGKSERVVGDILRGQDYRLSTKVGRLLRPGPMDDPSTLGWSDALPFTPVFDYSYDGIMRSYEDSQQRLGPDRIDILYVHDIDNYTHGDDNIRHFKDLRTSGYRAMDELRRTGAVKAIGLGVNDAQTCRTALTVGDWDVFLLAGRYILLEQNPLDDLLPECAALKDKT